MNHSVLHILGVRAQLRKRRDNIKPRKNQVAIHRLLSDAEEITGKRYKDNEISIAVADLEATIEKVRPGSFSVKV